MPLLPTDELELFPPCIRHVLKSVPEKAAAARQVPMIVTQFCVNAGLPDEMVHRLLKPRSNYDETLTQQKINKTRAERLSCYSCEKLATMHLCWRNAICKTLETPNPVGYYRKVRRYV